MDGQRSSALFFARRPWWLRLQRPREKPTAQRLRFLALAVAVIVALLIAASTSGPMRMADGRAYDFLSTIRLPAVSPQSPIVVAIDEPSFADLGLQWPWPRDVHARLVESLRKAGARAIGLDIIFAEPSRPEADAALAHALGRDTVLAADESVIETPQGNQIVRAEPLTDFTEAGARAGTASVGLDRDGAMRRMPGYEDGFATALLEASGRKAEPPAGALLRVFGPARSFQTVSYYQALDPHQFLPEGTFRGRTVIVGLSLQAAADIGAGGADAFATSYTVRTGRLISGAEVQATIYDNLARGLSIRQAGLGATAISLLAGALLAVLLVRRGTGWRTGPWALALLLAIVAASLMGIEFAHLYVSPLAPVLSFAGVMGAAGIRDFVAERRLRRGITRAFSQYLSPVLVERLASDPSLLKLGGETRVLTILFCDVRGFTTIAEGMKDEPEKLTALVNRLLSPLSQAILDHGGTIDKYIGDCIMAFWNAPIDDPDHAAHAVEAAVAMMAALDRLNAEIATEAARAGETAMALRIGIGINTGSCVVGNMGSETRFDYSALGDAVNLASRLESETKTVGVPLLIGASTAAALGDRFALADLGAIGVKGKALPVAVSTLAEFAPAANAVATQAARGMTA